MWRRLYAGQCWLRWRSVENICDELEHAIKRIPVIKAFNFADDNFSAMNLKQMQHFVHTYMDRIGFPFSCSVSPLFIDRERLDLLIRTGVYRISMGIQSASMRILKMYKRPIPIKAAQNAVKRLERARPLMREPRAVSYHFIVDNPYERPGDKVATLKFILNIPRRESVFTFSLVPFPGTAIYEMMCRDGLIVDEHSQIFTKDFFDLEPSFTRYWLYLYYGGVPAQILYALLKPGLVRIMDRGNPKWLFRIIYWTLEQAYRSLGVVKRLLARSMPAVKHPK